MIGSRFGFLKELLNGGDMMPSDSTAERCLGEYMTLGIRRRWPYFFSFVVN